MPLYVFECPEHGRDERLVKAGTARASCPACTRLMPRVYGYALAITHPEVDTRGMFRRYQEASADLAAKGAEPAARWPEVRRRAQAMTAAGENPYLARRWS